jgi:hypothetical protein
MSGSRPSSRPRANLRPHKKDGWLIVEVARVVKENIPAEMRSWEMGKGDLKPDERPEK